MKILCYAVVTAMTFTSIVGPVNVSAAKKAKVAKKTLTITEGKSRKIVIKNKKSKAKYLFKASNAKIKVTKKGKVTAVKAGKAKVTVTEKLKKKKRKIGVVTVKVKAAWCHHCRNPCRYTRYQWCRRRNDRLFRLHFNRKSSKENIDDHRGQVPEKRYPDQHE